MVVGVLIGLLVFAVVIAIVCWVVQYCLVTLLHAPATIVNVIYVIGVLVFLARLISVLPSLGVPVAI